jgi:hypothetical protein
MQQQATRTALDRNGSLVDLPEARAGRAPREVSTPRVEREPNGSHPKDLGVQIARLGRLHAELALAEVRRPLRAAVTAVATAAIAAVAVTAALVVLVAAGLAPLFGAPWRHLLIAGAGTAAVAGAAIAWSIWRLRRLALPRDTITSLVENWEWLVVQVKSRLTLR